MMYKLILVAALVACASAGNHTAGNTTTGGNVTVAAGTTTAAASTAGVAAPTDPTRSKKEKAKATLKGKREALKGAFDNFKKKKCGAAAGEAGEAGEAAKTAGRRRRTSPADSPVGRQAGTTADAATEIAAMSCKQLKAAVDAHKEKAKAVFAKLKAARTNKKCEGTKARLARTSPADSPVGRQAGTTADDDADIAELSCIELEDEIKTLKAQASAAGLELEASTDTPVGNTTVGTTTVAVPDSASNLAAGATAAVALAVALLC